MRPSASWRHHADAGDFPAAIAAWTAEFAGRESAADATWALGELEERWGDWLWFADEPGAARHYAAASGALIPPGARFDDGAEAVRRQEAFTRIAGKHLYGIGPDGRRRPGSSGHRHPLAVEQRAPVPPPVAAEPPAQPVAVAAASPPQPSTHAPSRRRGPSGSGLARRLVGLGHWQQVELGERWLAAARALLPVDAGAGRIALAEALACFERYREAWVAGLPASRWDSDYGDVIGSLGAELAGLPASDPRPDLPRWVRLVLDFRPAGALAAGTGDGADLQPVRDLLAAMVQLGDGAADH